MRCVRALQLTVVVVFSCFLVAWSQEVSVFAQNGQSATVVHLQVSAADQIAADSRTDHHVHILPVRSSKATGAPGAARFSPLANEAPAAASKESAAQSTGSTQASAAATVPSVPSPGFYPDDLSSSGGKVVTTAQFNDLYVNCAASCWGSPATFEGHLGSSDFIHVADQYVGVTGNNRYTVGAPSSITYPVSTTLADSDILQIVHAGARTHGSGYDHIYNVFLPEGVDVCFTGTTMCYSPDNPSTFAFCAYHASVTFPDIGHVLFSVEPFQAVTGCDVPQPSPNGELIDSTSSALSHELIETITDPDPPTGWTAQTGLIVSGAEIGDLCQNTTGKFGPITLSGKQYEIQPEYSNKFHACATVP
jgi:hypothetical protein